MKKIPVKIPAQKGGASVLASRPDSSFTVQTSSLALENARLRRRIRYLERVVIPYCNLATAIVTGRTRP